MAEYRVTDLRSTVIGPAVKVEARSPEQAAQFALGVRANRMARPNALVCNVFRMHRGSVEVVSLYL